MKSKFVKAVIIYWLPLILYMSFIFYLSSLPNPVKTLAPKGLYVFYLDLPRIIYHIIEYGVLSLLFFRALKDISKHSQLSSILFSALYGISDEFHQSIVPGRIPSTNDVLIDIFGAVAMQSIINIYYYYLKAGKIKKTKGLIKFSKDNTI